MTWRITLQLALSGLSIGSIYALVGLALVLPFKASGIVNFAQGEIVTFGAYLAAASLFVLLTIPLARLTDWLILRDRRRRQAGGLLT